MRFPVTESFIQLIWTKQWFIQQRNKWVIDTFNWLVQNNDYFRMKTTVC